MKVLLVILFLTPDGHWAHKIGGEYPSMAACVAAGEEMTELQVRGGYICKP